MKKIFLLLLLHLSFSGVGQSNAELSESIFKMMLRNRFDSIQVYFDTSITNKMNAGTMQNMWEMFPNYVGEYKHYTDIRTEKADSLEAVLILVAFEKAKLDLKMVYNKTQKIVGIFFLPPKSKSAYNLPDYYEASKQYETKLSVKTGTFEMPGLLCIPNIIENPPVVILVAGSGPNDKDETIGPNKPLKDIALGLAANGIASFRYDKRTKVYGSALDMERTGIEEEVIDDVLSAIKVLRAHTATKTSKIFIAGHSLGAMCAPLIASKSKEVSGIIMLAGPARGMEDLIAEQYEYIATLDSVNQKMMAVVPELKRKAEVIKDPKKLKKAEAKDLPFGIPRYYWQSVKKYDIIAIAKKIKQPLLVLQGERDYQVLMKDFEIWKKELSSDPKNKFISYPFSNHLFMKGEGKSRPDEYTRSNNVEHKVILDMAKFIKSVK